MSDDLLDSLLQAATESLKKRAASDADTTVPEAPMISNKRKRTSEDQGSVEKTQKKSDVAADGKPAVLSAAARADAMKKEQEAKAAKLDKNSKKEKAVPTSGSKWFDLPGQGMTPEIKQHLQVLNMRHVIDPKRHYKRMGKKGSDAPKFFQVGTLVEGAGEYYSSRIPKRDKNKTLVDELMADAESRLKYKEKFQKLQSDRVKRGKQPLRGKGKKKQRR